MIPALIVPEFSQKVKELTFSEYAFASSNERLDYWSKFE